MTSASRTPQQNSKNDFQPASLSFLEPYKEGPQSYNTSGLELDLSRQPALELAYLERRSNRGLQHEKTPSEKMNGLRRPTFLLLVALITAIIITAVLGGTVGSLIIKEKADSSLDSKHASTINNGTVIVSRTTAISQQSASSTTTSSSSDSSSSSPPANESTPIITLGPSETYSIISSPTLTLSRDCPGSNGTTVVTNDIPHQTFIKNCGWLYNLYEPSGDAFQAVTSTLDACISLCAAYNVMNGTGPLGNCAAVEWRTDLSQTLAGYCFGKFDQKAGDGEPAVGGKNPPVDAALFLGWS